MNSCASLDFEADITANQTVSPSTDSNVTAGNQQGSSHLVSLDAVTSCPIDLFFAVSFDTS